MGRMERESAIKSRNQRVRKVILESVKLAGLATVLVVAPNVVGAMAKLGMVRTRGQGQRIQRSCDRLIRAGLLSRNEQGRLRLTPKGEKYLQLLEAKESMRKKPGRWDGKWRVLIFDIPELRKNMRNRVRLTLKEIGFELLQDSVWVYPYDCEDLVTLLKADFRIGKDMRYMIVDAIEGDGLLRKHFDLK